MWIAVLFLIVLVIDSRLVLCDPSLPLLHELSKISLEDRVWYPLEDGILPTGLGHVVALGDFNGDKWTDLVLVDDTQHVITVYLFDTNSRRFMQDQKIELTSDRVVLDVVALDLDLDGRLDLLVTHGLLGAPESAFQLDLYNMQSDRTFQLLTLNSTSRLPHLVDVTGQLKMNILFADSVTFQPQFRLENGSFVSFQSQIPSAPTCSVAPGFSHANVDLNGDCRADLVLFCEATDDPERVDLLIYLRNSAGDLIYAGVNRLPSGAGLVRFADMNGDGMVDMVFLTGCQAQQCTSDASLVILYSQTPVQAANSICQQQAQYGFDVTRMDRIELSTLLPSNSQLKTRDEKSSGDRLGGALISLHLGDYNSDGYPDCLLAAKQDSNSFTVLLENQPCSASSASNCRRQFQSVERGNPSLASFTSGTVQPFFMDLGEDGTLDVLVNAYDTNGKRTVLGALNLFASDAFFMKTLSKLSLELDSFLALTSAAHEFYVPSNLAGSVIQYTVTDDLNQLKLRVVHQLSQSSYSSLQTPYSLFGLGRTNSYVEQMCTGITGISISLFCMTSVIPNSQLIMAPPTETAATDEWRVELLVNPGEYAQWVLVSVIVTLIVLGALVAALHWRERREDHLERRRKLHAINFDAL